jgi:hypothetical protein
MIVAEMPFDEFLGLLRRSGKECGFGLLALLIAREADCSQYFAELERDWTSLHDVTGERVLFVTVDGTSYSPLDGQSMRKGAGCVDDGGGMVVFSSSCKMYQRVRNERLQPYHLAGWVTKHPDPNFISRYSRHQRREQGWREDHTLGISQLVRQLPSMSESDIPCLYFELLASSRSFHVPIGRLQEAGLSFYVLFKAAIERIGVIFSSDWEIYRTIRDRDARKRAIPLGRLRSVYNSIEWVRNWVTKRQDLPSAVRAWINDAMRGEAAPPSVFANILPLKTVLEPREFTRLRAHLNRITACPLPEQSIAQLEEARGIDRQIEALRATISRNADTIEASIKMVVQQAIEVKRTHMGRREIDESVVPEWDSADLLGLVRFVRVEDPHLRNDLHAIRTRLGAGFPDLVAEGKHALLCCAAYEVISAHDWLYDFEPGSPDYTRQRIRSPREMHADRVGTCLDLACLFAALLECMQASPVVVRLAAPGAAHALAGCWLKHSPGKPLLDDRQSVCRAVSNADLLLFEATGAVRASQTVAGEQRSINGNKLSFQVAQQVARNLVLDSSMKVDFLIDVLVARQ